MSEIKRVPEIYPIPGNLPEYEPDLPSEEQEQEESSEQKDNPTEGSDATSKLSEQRLQADYKRNELWSKLEEFERNKKES